MKIKLLLLLLLSFCKASSVLIKMPDRQRVLQLLTFTSRYGYFTIGDFDKKTGFCTKFANRAIDLEEFDYYWDQVLQSCCKQYATKLQCPDAENTMFNMLQCRQDRFLI